MNFALLRAKLKPGKTSFAPMRAKLVLTGFEEGLPADYTRADYTLAPPSLSPRTATFTGQTNELAAPKPPPSSKTSFALPRAKLKPGVLPAKRVLHLCAQNSF